MNGWLSARYRLLFVIAIILIIGFGITNFISYQISKSSLRQAILDNELPLSSNTIYSEIQADLLRPIFVSSLMAQDTFLRDWVLAGEQSAKPIVKYLEEIRKKYSAHTSFFISNNSLNYYHFSGISRQINTQDPADNWFTLSKDMAEPYSINLDLDQESNNALTVFINYKVFDYNENFIGITGVGLGLTALSDLITQYQENYRRSIYFIDQEGAIKLHSNQPLNTTDSIFERPGISSIAADILSTKQGSFTYTTANGTMLLTSRFIPELNWYVLVELNESEAMSAIKESLKVNLLIEASIIAIVLLCLLFTLNGFHRRLEKISLTDKLSGLGNRQHFDQAIEQLLLRCKRDQSTHAILLLDIDHFKQINDQYGHAIGDHVIQNLSRHLQLNTQHNDTIYRWGGEEFIILMDHSSIEQARQFAERLRLTIQQSSFIPTTSQSITVSAGLTLVHDHDDPLSAFSRADQALYRAKEKGRNRLEIQLEVPEQQNLAG